jgi:Arc/MetJ-type ribon-helix-helix transcriptional regulator
MRAVFQSSSKLFKSVPRENVSSFGRRHEWYDIGMTMAKIAISLPKDQLARVHREVRAGRADSVSGYIASALAEQEKRDSLRTLLRDLIEQHGKPAPEDVKWAERMLPRRGPG